MSILTSASSTSVYRGYEYSNNDKVDKIIQLSDNEYEGYVKGSRKEPYYVKIDINHPRKSYCDCPFANGHKTCKHMVALYFSIFPDEAKDYNEWYNSDYYDDNEDDYDRYDNYYYYDDYYDDEDEGRYNKFSNNKFNKPLFFDLVLKKYINNLDINKLREVLENELKNNEERTYELYLKNNYKRYLGNYAEDYSFLEKINNRIKEMINIYDYNYLDYSKVILNNNEKRKINELYNKKELREIIDKMLMIPELAIYNDYMWVVNFYLTNKIDITNFVETLEEYFKTLKYYGIKKDTPKSNVLIVLYSFKNLSIDELAENLLKNGKYNDYVEYAINNNDFDSNELYRKVISKVRKNYIPYKSFLPNVLYSFNLFNDFQNEQINSDCEIYSYLCTGKILYLEYSHMDKKDIIKSIELLTKDKNLLTNLYRNYHKVDKLWNLLNKDDNKYLLINNVDMLKDKYGTELNEFFTNQIFDVLSNGKERKNYEIAARYVKAISQLNIDEINYIKNIINKLENSQYKKCTALFEEIQIALR